MQASDKNTNVTKEPDFTKCGGLLPAIVQDAQSGAVLMLGYMNQEAYALTKQKRLVTFFSRSRNALWTKGETSGNYLTLREISCDCDQDAILVIATPSGPTCHEGTSSCFAAGVTNEYSFLDTLSETMVARRLTPKVGSYTSALFSQGIDKIVQKVGEEAVEVVIEGKNGDRDRLLNESADLLFHLMVLWQARAVSFKDVCQVLKGREGGNRD